MKLLFVGESWQGSCARSLREAFARQAGIAVSAIREEDFLRSGASWRARITARLAAPFDRWRLGREIEARVAAEHPDVLMVYKGFGVDRRWIARIQALGVKTVNVYPDNSPHAFGRRHRQAVGAYDLVFSTKPFHPPNWASTYGYGNRCLFVPHGYDQSIHLRPDPPREQIYDIGIIATWRAQYEELMVELANRAETGRLNVVVGGSGWFGRRHRFPRHWDFPGAVHGPDYINVLRKARICIAPVHRVAVVNGVVQPGDSDSTRTYELAAGFCFFIHRRTEFAQCLYDECAEVPMYGSAQELAEKIVYFLPRENERRLMAAAAHARAVPAYSFDARAVKLLSAMRESGVP